jgi:hypothetical protein
MNLRKHKRAYLGTTLVVVSVAILWMLIAVTSSRTIQTNETLKSGINGSAISVKCTHAKNCISTYVQAMVTVSDDHGKSTTVKTNIGGQFTVKLAPGAYTATASGARDAKQTAPSQQLTVQKDKFTRITFNF